MKTLLALTTLLILSAPSAFACDDCDGKDTASKEDRAKMAEMHQKMADCLKSDKPMDECKKEMHKSCPMCDRHHHGKAKKVEKKAEDHADHE